MTGRLGPREAERERRRRGAERVARAEATLRERVAPPDAVLHTGDAPPVPAWIVGRWRIPSGLRRPAAAGPVVVTVMDPREVWAARPRRRAHVARVIGRGPRPVPLVGRERIGTVDAALAEGLQGLCDRATDPFAFLEQALLGRQPALPSRAPA